MAAAWAARAPAWWHIVPPPLVWLRLRHRLIRPEWISNQTETTAEREAGQAHQIEPPGYLWGLLPFHRWRGFGHGVALWALTFAAIAFTSWSAARLFVTDLAIANAAAYARPLFTVAGILGSVSTILFAIIVFGLQVYARRLRDSHFLVRYVARHEGLIPLASLVLGVIAANLVLGLLAGAGIVGPAKILALLNVILVPLALLIALWLLHRILIAAAGDVQREGLLPVLRWEYARALDENDRIDQLKRHYHALLSGLGLTHGFGTRFHLAPEKCITYTVRGNGTIKDVSRSTLRRLSRKLESLHPGAKHELTVTIGDNISNHEVLVVSPSDESEASQTLEHPTPTERHKIEELLRVSFWLGQPQQNELADVLSLLGEALVEAARQGHYSKLKDMLDLHQQLVAHALARPATEPVVDTLWRELPDCFNSWAFHRAGHAVVGYADQELLGLYVQSVGNICETALEQKHKKILFSAGQVLCSVYYRAVTTSTLVSQTVRRIDNVLGDLFMRAAYDLRKQPESQEGTDSETSVQTLCSLVLELLKIAVDCDRPEDAELFSAHLLDPVGNWGDYHRDPRQPVSDGVDKTFLLARVILVGWCIHTLRHSKHNCEAARQLGALVVDIPKPLTQAALIHLQESTPELEEGAGLVQAFHWALASDEIRVGRSRGGTGREDWVLEGLAAMLLTLHGW